MTRKSINSFFGYLLIVVIASYNYFTINDKTNAFYVLAIIISVSHILITYRYKEFYTILKSMLLLYAFSVLCLLSSLWSMVPFLTINKSISLFIFLLSINSFLVSYRYNKSIMNALMIVLSLSISLLFIYFYLKYGTIRFIYRETDGVSGSISNSLTAQIIIILPWLLAMFQTKRMLLKKILLMFLVTLVIFTIILSQSRGAYLLTGITFASYFFLSSPSRKKHRRLKKSLFVFFIVIVGVFVFLNINLADNQLINPVLERITNSKLVSSNGSGDELRGNMYTSIPHILSNYPLGGIGFEAYSEYSKNNYGIKEFSHSILLTATEVGIFGILIMGGVFMVSLSKGFGLYFKSTIERNNQAIAIVTSLVVALSHSIFRPQLQNFMFLLIISFIFIVHRKDI